MPLPPAPHGTTNRWRTGCHDCPECSAAHNADLRSWRRRQSDTRFPPAVRNELLRLIREGTSLRDAVDQFEGLTLQLVQSRSRIDARWQERLDKALMAGRNPDLEHGRETTYRYGQCRCPECRTAHDASR